MPDGCSSKFYFEPDRWDRCTPAQDDMVELLMELGDELITSELFSHQEDVKILATDLTKQIEVRRLKTQGGPIHAATMGDEQSLLKPLLRDHQNPVSLKTETVPGSATIPPHELGGNEVYQDMEKGMDLIFKKLFGSGCRYTPRGVRFYMKEGDGTIGSTVPTGPFSKNGSRRLGRRLSLSLDQPLAADHAKPGYHQHQIGGRPRSSCSTVVLFGYRVFGLREVREASTSPNPVCLLEGFSVVVVPSVCLDDTYGDGTPNLLYHLGCAPDDGDGMTFKWQLTLPETTDSMKGNQVAYAVAFLHALACWKHWEYQVPDKPVSVNMSGTVPKGGNKVGSHINYASKDDQASGTGACKKHSQLKEDRYHRWVLVEGSPFDGRAPAAATIVRSTLKQKEKEVDASGGDIEAQKCWAVGFFYYFGRPRSTCKGALYRIPMFPILQAHT